MTWTFLFISCTPTDFPYLFYIYLYILAVSPNLGGSRQHKRNNKNNGGFTVLLAMTWDPAEFGQHCWSNTAHPPPSSTTYVASWMQTPLLPLPQGCLYKGNPVATEDANQNCVTITRHSFLFLARSLASLVSILLSFRALFTPSFYPNLDLPLALLPSTFAFITFFSGCSLSIPVTLQYLPYPFVPLISQNFLLVSTSLVLYLGQLVRHPSGGLVIVFNLIHQICLVVCL